MDIAPEGPVGDLSDWRERGVGGLFGAAGVQVTRMSDWLLHRHPELRQ
jgi:hypothetical protein